MIALTKYDELRLKTDGQLIQLANHEFELGTCYALEALRFADDRTSSQRHFGLARTAYANANRLIALAIEIRPQERARLESKSARLRGVLEVLAAAGSDSVPTQDRVAAFAHALWEARGCPEGLPEEDWFRAERALNCHAA